MKKGAILGVVLLVAATNVLTYIFSTQKRELVSAVAQAETNSAIKEKESYTELAKAGKRSSREDERHGLLNQGNKSQRDFISAFGQINSETLKDAGVSPEMAPQVQSLVDALRDKAEKLVASNITADEKNTDKEKGILAYLIKGDPDASEQLLTEFEVSLTSLVGPGAAKGILRDFHPAHYYGGLGRFDVSLKFSTQVLGNETEAEWVQVDARDSVKGQAAFHIYGNRETLTDYFGNAFDFVELK